ncbi:MAG: hypothetical protein ACKVU1_17705 [bacterium]
MTPKLSSHGRLAYLILIPLFLLALRPISDMDFWWHLAAGRWIAENGAVPRVDPFTNTAGGQPWVAHEWLAEYVFWIVFQGTGLRGVQVLITLAVIGGLAIHLSTLRRTGVTGVLPGVAYVLLLYFLFSPRIQTRPHVFGDFFFVAIFYRIVTLADWRPSGRQIALIAALTALWANFHSGATLACIVLGVAACAEVARAWWARRGARAAIVASADAASAGSLPALAAPLDLGRARALALATAAAFIALVATPSHVHRLLFPLQVFHVTTQSITIGEWRPLFLVSEPSFFPILWIVPALIHSFLLVLFLRLRAASWAETSAAAVLGAMAIAASRFAVFFFAQAHAVLRAVAAGARSRAINAMLAVWIAALAALIWNHDVGMWEEGIVRQMSRAGVSAFAPVFEPNFPSGAVRFLKETRLDGRMFNIPRWGGYLTYHLYPDYKTSYDGRIDLFGGEISRDMMDAMENKEREAVFSKYGFDYLVVDSRFFAPARPPAEHWKLVFSEGSARIYLRETARNAANFDRCRAYYAAHGGAPGEG